MFEWKTLYAWTTGHPWKTASVATAIVVAIFLWAGTASPTYQSCQYENNDAYRNDYTNRTSKGAETFAICEAQVIGENGEFITAIATIVLTISTAGLWWVTRQTLQHAEKSSERQLRAYVYISEIKGVTKNDSNLELSVDIKNFGQTPAYDISVHIYAGAGEWPDAEIPAHEIEELLHPQNRPQFNLPPSHITVNSFAINNITEYLARIDSGNYAVLIYGVIAYVDAFKETRHTRFRYAWNKIAVENGGKLTYAHHGNISD